MQNLELFEQPSWQPLAKFGLTSEFWNINSHTIIYSWVTLFVLLVVCLFFRLYIQKTEASIVKSIVITIIRSFKDLISQTLGKFFYLHFALTTSIFIFIFFNNIISIIPGIEEPTTDPNTTIALGLVAFLYIQASAIKLKGFTEYIKEFFQPFFIMFPLHVIGEIAKVISISFRLFGNIFGGSIISKLWLSFISGGILKELIGIISGINLLILAFFVLFEGFIQAFVFFMLTVTYLSIALQQEEPEGVNE